MFIGIVTDIHEQIDFLQRALEEFQRRQVDLVVSLGDACDTFGPGSNTAEVARMLRQAKAIGVWGNHDVGLCYDVSESIRSEAEPELLDFMAGMRPTLVIEDCHFSHVEPWLDPHKVEDLWYFDGPPESAEQAYRSFAAVPQRFLFLGHFHRWLVMTSAAKVPWNGEQPIVLNDAARYLIVVAPVVSGWCATFDTISLRLTPIRCYDRGELHNHGPVE